MHWFVLLISAGLEAVWATALGASQGFTQPIPTTVFLLTLGISMLTLGYVIRAIPISTAYAVWAGVGSALTVSWAMITGTETVSAIRVTFILGIIGCVVGLKLVKGGARAKPKPDLPAEILR